MGSFEAKSRAANDWSARLMKHFKENMTPEERRPFEVDGEDEYGWTTIYREFAASKFRLEQGIKINPYTPPLNAIEPHEIPRIFLTEKSYSILAAIINLGGIFGVNSEVRQLIEELEPGVHLFFDMPIQMPRGKMYKEDQYSIVVIGTFLSSFVPTEKQLESTKGHYLRAIRSEFYNRKSDIASLRMERSKFSGHHLWRERRFQSGLICLSDEFFEAIAEAGLDIPKHAKMVEV